MHFKKPFAHHRCAGSGLGAQGSEIVPEPTSFSSVGIAAPRFIPGVDYSDHAAYLDEGYPALMVTDTAPYRYPHYHSRQDTVDKVDFHRVARVVQGMEGVVRGLALQP